MDLPVSRRWLARGLVVIVVLALLTPAGVSALTYDPSEVTELEPKTVKSPAEGITVVGIQGFKLSGESSGKKPARLAAFGPRGKHLWTYNGSGVGATWFYDVDPIPNGNLLVTATRPNSPGRTTVIALDPDTREPVWIERFPYVDTHDVDLINGDQLLIANMRNYNRSTGKNNDRILIYDRSKGKVVWEWLFRNHYNRSEHRNTGTGKSGQWTHDWTHVNDVDKIGDGRYLVSPRNFDQVIVVNRSTNSIEMRLGADGKHGILHEQHNPQYLETESGRPAILVADSENDRIVEYEKRNGQWKKTWELGSIRSFSWPRDADRLPNGNTLIVDSLNHRVLEVTPRGEVVWSVAAPWGTFDAERIRWGDEAYGHDRPTISDLDAEGTYPLSSSGISFAGLLYSTFEGTPLEGPVGWFAAKWAHVTPWIQPVWMSGWDFALTAFAALILLGWGLTEAVLARRRIAGFLRTLPDRVRQGS